jgi:hypothetical protein
MFRRISFFVLCVCLTVGSAVAQQTQPPGPVAQSSSTTQPPNADALKKVVGFLRVGFLKDAKPMWQQGPVSSWFTRIRDSATTADSCTL